MAKGKIALVLGLVVLFGLALLFIPAFLAGPDFGSSLSVTFTKDGQAVPIPAAWVAEGVEIDGFDTIVSWEIIGDFRSDSVEMDGTIEIWLAVIDIEGVIEPNSERLEAAHTWYGPDLSGVESVSWSLASLISSSEGLGFRITIKAFLHADAMGAGDDVLGADWSDTAFFDVEYEEATSTFELNGALVVP